MADGEHEIKTTDEAFHDFETDALNAIVGEVGSDVGRILDALHQLAAKVSREADISTDSFLRGAAHHYTQQHGGHDA